MSFTEQLPILIAIGMACLLMPPKILFMVSLLGVLLADTRLVSPEVIYLTRFVPVGVLSLRVLSTFMLRKSSNVRGNSMLNAWLPFLLLAALSVSYSLEPAKTIQRAISALFAITAFGLGIPIYFRSPRKMKLLIRMIFSLMGGLMLYSLFSGSGQPSMTLDSEELDRVYGVFRNPNTLGLVAMQTIFLGIYLMRTERQRLLRYIIILTTVGAGVTIIASGSRASALGFLVGMLVFMWIDRRIQQSRYRTALITILIIATASLTTAYLFPESFGILLRTESSGRQTLLQRDWELALEAPYFGVGFGGSDQLFFENTLYLRSMGIYALGSHSSPMKLLVELGFTGVILAMSAFFVLLRRALKLLPWFENAQLGVLLFALISASFVNSLFEAWLFGFGNSITLPFWLCVALLSFQCDAVLIQMKLAKLEHFTHNTH